MAGISRDARRLRKAIERDQLSLAYQPKADMRTGRIVGVEALVRWPTARRGMTGPADFIPRAERSGATIQALTEWTLDAAMYQARTWDDAGHHLTIAVNLSPRSVLDSTLGDTLRRLMERWDVRPALIQLELTETAVFGIADPARVTATLGELSEMGLLLALDDFGTGYSSLARLRDLPIDKVKIDKSFVTRMDESAHDALIVRSVIALAKSLGLRVVAEGVEREAVWHRLSELGCDVAQGNYLSAPLAPEALVAWVRQWEELFAEAHRMASELLERRSGLNDRRSGTPDRRDDPTASDRRFTRRGSSGERVA
jgi:EAL domain-containing protein (putative c-di-GMP-specific phosphodiesterase class I)